MAGHDIIVAGASAGGVEALARLVAGLPADLPAAVFIVLHVPAHSASALPGILTRAGRLPAAHAHDGEAIRPGRIYVAPPDHHLLLRRDVVRVVRGPRENGHRPALDPLFRSAARWYGARVVGVVLSGGLDDGTAGLMEVKRGGGVAVAQDPNDALYPSMPLHALENVAVDHCLPLAGMPALLERLAREPVRAEGAELPPESERETDIVEMDLEELQRGDRPGSPSVFGCPDCGGVLWELPGGSLPHFRCRVGHAWSADSLMAKQGDGLEAALWTALRALEENAALARRMAARAHERRLSRAAQSFQEQVREAEQHAAVIRQVLLSRSSIKLEGPAEAVGDDKGQTGRE